MVIEIEFAQPASAQLMAQRKVGAACRESRRCEKPAREKGEEYARVAIRTAHCWWAYGRFEVEEQLVICGQSDSVAASDGAKKAAL